MAKKYNLVGKKFGRLTVISSAGLLYGSHKGWSCACDCGGSAVSTTHKLVSGEKLSCGCLENENRQSLKTHGKYGTRTYRCWQNMKTRCTNKKNKFFHQYGGRGITICEKWYDFAEFYADMGECPEGMTIERIDNNAGYSRENCRWATRVEQNNNRSSNITIMIHGREQTLKQWSSELGVKYTTAYWRFNAGWSPERIFNLEK